MISDVSGEAAGRTSTLKVVAWIIGLLIALMILLPLLLIVRWEATATPEQKARSAAITAAEDSRTVGQAMVAASLRDPASAQFRDVFTGGVAGRAVPDTVCGEVNARNGFGGYVGYARFVAAASKGAVTIDPGNRATIADRNDFEAMWNANCSRPISF